MEISLDGDWWAQASKAEQRALLDHEMHHIQVSVDKRGIVYDDLHRPVVTMRRHDYDFGWFKVIAERHGKESMECQFAALIMEESGQLFWPEIARKVMA